MLGTRWVPPRTPARSLPRDHPESHTGTPRGMWGPLMGKDSPGDLGTLLTPPAPGAQGLSGPPPTGPALGVQGQHGDPTGWPPGDPLGTRGLREPYVGPQQEWGGGVLLRPPHRVPPGDPPQLRDPPRGPTQEPPNPQSPSPHPGRTWGGPWGSPQPPALTTGGHEPCNGAAEGPTSPPLTPWGAHVSHPQGAPN